MKRPMSESAGWIFTADRITRGDTTLSVTFWITTDPTRATRASIGLSNSASSTANATATHSPMTGMKCSTPTRIAASPAYGCPTSAKNTHESSPSNTDVMTVPRM